MSSLVPRNWNCVFINSNNPSSHNRVIDGTQPNIKLPFPPYIDPYDLVVESQDGKIPSRAPNAFIIYRKIFIQCARDEGYFLPMTVISSMASKSWKQENDDVKEEYRRLAKEAFEVRNEMLPKANRKRKREKWNYVSFGERSRRRPVLKTQNPAKEVTDSTSEVVQSVNVDPLNLQINDCPSFEQYNFDIAQTQYMIPPEIPEMYSSPGSSISSPEINDYSPPQSLPNNSILSEEELFSLVSEQFLTNYNEFENFRESEVVDPLTFSTETINISMYSGNDFDFYHY